MLVFFAALLIYNVHRLISLPADPADDLSPMHKWMRHYSMFMYGMLGVALFAVIVGFLLLNRPAQITLIFLGIISILYAFPVSIFSFEKIRLRDFGLIKPFIVGLVWAVVTVLLPILNYDPGLGKKLLAALFLEKFIFISALTIPFDIRDIEDDKTSLKFKTITLKWGVEVTKKVAMLMLFLHLVVIGFVLKIWFPATLPFSVIAYCLTAVFAFILIRNTRQDSGEYHYTFWIDSVILVQAGLVLMTVCIIEYLIK